MCGSFPKHSSDSLRVKTGIRDLSRWPIMVAPMAGGPSTPELMGVAAQAGTFGFLASGYKTARAMEADILALRGLSDEPFGVNVFVPQASTAEPSALAAYVESLKPDADRLRTSVVAATWDDDDWDAKLRNLLADPPAMVSFTFGCPSIEVIEAFQDNDSLVAVTVTTPDEALVAARARADYIVAQGFEAGGHRGSFANDDRPAQDFGLLALIGEIRRVTNVPIIAAGGIAGPEVVAAVLAAGAVAAMLGTAFLRCPESGTRQAHKEALVDPRFSTTAVTRAFTGRRARGLVNQFMLDHRDGPAAYPEVHHATLPIRRAAAEANDPDRLHLWAGQGFKSASDRSVGEVIEQLAQGATRVR